MIRLVHLCLGFRYMIIQQGLVPVRLLAFHIYMHAHTNRYSIPLVGVCLVLCMFVFYICYLPYCCIHSHCYTMYYDALLMRVGISIHTAADGNASYVHVFQNAFKYILCAGSTRVSEVTARWPLFLDARNGEN